jgi:hypothetical protein
MGLYKAILECLKRLPASLDDVTSLAPLLSAAFGRVLEPASGPILFKAFCEETVDRLGVAFKDLPPDLHPCISSALEFFKLHVPEGLLTQAEADPQAHAAATVLSTPLNNPVRLENVCFLQLCAQFAPILGHDGATVVLRRVAA